MRTQEPALENLRTMGKPGHKTPPESAPSSEPAPPPNQPSRGSLLAAKARMHLAKREAQKFYNRQVAANGPQAEELSKLYAGSEIIDVASIIDDPEFVNVRRSMDPVKLTLLQESLELEGLRTPITVVEAPVNGCYHVRAGFRRLAAVKNLGWETIAAIVLPLDTPEAEEYWINILENTARENLSTYELAEAAKMMRDRFKVSPSDFAKKSGKSLELVRKALQCLDHLPDPVIDCWRRGEPIPFSILVKLSEMTHSEAIRNCGLWKGQHHLDATSALRNLQKTTKQQSEKLWTAKGVERTQRLFMAIKISKLPRQTKELCLDIIKYLQGGKHHIPGLVIDKRQLAESSQQNWLESETRPRRLNDISQENCLPSNTNSLNVPNTPNQQEKTG